MRNIQLFDRNSVGAFFAIFSYYIVSCINSQLDWFASDIESWQEKINEQERKSVGSWRRGLRWRHARARPIER